MTAAPAHVSRITAETLADVAVEVLHREADLTPKPGLVDRRGTGAHTDMNLCLLHRSAEALRPFLADCASAATGSRCGTALRAQLGVIGRAGEAAMLDATGGVNTHRGALWALGLLCAGAALAGSPVANAARLARMTDPALPTRVTLSHGELARYRYGAGGALAEAQRGFPHVQRYGLPALATALAAGADDTTAQLDALLTLMAHVDDTCVLHRDGPAGLLAVQSGARAVLDAGGYRTAAGRLEFGALDDLCLIRRISPGGSADLLTVTLFLHTLNEGASSCKR